MPLAQKTWLTVSLIFWALGFAPARAAQKKPIVMGFRAELGSNDMAQLIQLVKSLSTEYSKKHPRPVQLFLSRKDGEYSTALRQGTVDIGFNNPIAALSLGYRPWLRLSLFDVKANADCLMVKQDTGLAAPAQLKNRTVAIVQDSFTRYFRLREFLGHKPETFFKQMAPYKNDASMVYSLALGQVDAAWVNLWAFKLLERTNPGPTKKVKLLGCRATCPEFMYHHPRLTKAELASLKTFLGTVRTNPDLKRYRALMHLTGVGFGPITPAEIAQCQKDDRLTDQRTNGDWGRDYRRWQTYVNQKME